MTTARNWLAEAELEAEGLAYRLAHLSAAEVAQVLEYLKDQWETQQEAQAAAGQRRSYQPSEASERYQPRA